MKPLADAKINRKKLKAALRFRSRKLSGIETGLPSVDRYLLGLGGLTIIQGETGRKKSILGLQIAHHNMKLGNPVILIDEENGEGRITLRLMCQASRISLTDAKACTKEEFKAYFQAVTDYPFYLYTESIRETGAIANRIKEALELHKGQKLIVVIDALQGMPRLCDDERQSLEEWLRFMNRMKRKYDGRVYFLVMSEKHRQGYSATSAVGAAKGTGQIEYKAETLLDLRDGSTNDSVFLKVIKNRDGDKGEQFELRNVLADPRNPKSFCFLLTEDEDEEIAI